jgi:hypothetical protein
MTQTTKGAASVRLLSHFGLASLSAAAILFALTFSLRHASAKQIAQNDLTVHEWGTFTSIEGPDGRAMDWLPLRGSTDLPDFVEHFREVAFKGGLCGTVRMETPVLYFYSPQETTVSVNVSFHKGLITEWYPHANSANSGLTPKDFALFNMKNPGAISWNSVHIDPHAAADFRWHTARKIPLLSRCCRLPSPAQRHSLLGRHRQAAKPFIRVRLF